MKAFKIEVYADSIPDMADQLEELAAIYRGKPGVAPVQNSADPNVEQPAAEAPKRGRKKAEVLNTEEPKTEAPTFTNEDVRQKMIAYVNAAAPKLNKDRKAIFDDLLKPFNVTKTPELKSEDLPKMVELVAKLTAELPA